MTGTGSGCSQNTDPLALIRQGSSKAEWDRANPLAHLVPVDEHRPEHAMVFAAAYADFLTYVDVTGDDVGTWREFFESDPAARPAVAAVEDVAVYRSTVKSLLRALESASLPPQDIPAALGAVFDCAGTLAARLDELVSALPPTDRFGAVLGDVIQGQLSPMLRRLLGYHAAGTALGVLDPAAPTPVDTLVLGKPVQAFGTLRTRGLSAPQWPAGVHVVDWATFAAVEPADYEGAYGSDPDAAERATHLASHNLFTTACDAFLAAHARVVRQARTAVEESFDDNRHQPHYALFMAFLELREHVRAQANTLTGRHLDFYYRQVLRLGERPALPSHAHVLVQLAKHIDMHLLAQGTELRAGKNGADRRFAVDRDLVANRGVVVELRSIYRHPVDGVLARDRGRIFARASAGTEPSESFHPFVEEIFEDGELERIDMAPAETGFAVASHHLWMAEGARTIDIAFMTREFSPRRSDKGELMPEPVNLRCRLTTAKGWFDTEAGQLTVGKGESKGSWRLHLSITLTGGDPAITPYDRSVHGYAFATSLPVLLVQPAHDDSPWDYTRLAGLRIRDLTVRVTVEGVRTLVLANDHGPVDASKPFLTYGSTPTSNSSLVIGSREVFQKAPSKLTVHMHHMASAQAMGTPPGTTGYALRDGVWSKNGPQDADVNLNSYEFSYLPDPEIDPPELTPQPPFSTAARTGFIRLTLNRGFGLAAYPVEVVRWISGDREDKPKTPRLPMLESLTVDYIATHDVDLSAPSERNGRFFHVTPFGHAELTASTPQAFVPLLPGFWAGSSRAEGALYLGVDGLQPPQDLSLLFQVVEGTINPLVTKPAKHIHWAYLRGDEWMPLAPEQVADGTQGLLTSGIVTISVPADATTTHTSMPPDRRWLRLSVASRSDAVCRLLTVAAQALRATCPVHSADEPPALPPGTITKLDTPDPAVKSIEQPYPTFGGRPAETPTAFVTRVSERLRHKDRAIALWDYEHLVLDAFPAVYQVRCLDHTRYEPTENGAGTYRELAPGHVTVVTIPDLAMPNPRDPLRPFTSASVLGDIEKFLSRRMSCFARLHVRNPQFEQVVVELRVRFRDGVDETFHVGELKRQITEFLSPWAYRGDARPSFNGTVNKSSITNFVEERPYVDYLTDLRLFRRLPGATGDGPDLDEVVGSRPISILVSAPAAEHRIHVIPVHQVVAPHGCSCSEVNI